MGKTADKCVPTQKNRSTTVLIGLPVNGVLGPSRAHSTGQRNKRNSAADQEKFVAGSRHHNYWSATKTPRTTVKWKGQTTLVSRPFKSLTQISYFWLFFPSHRCDSSSHGIGPLLKDECLQRIGGRFHHFLRVIP